MRNASVGERAKRREPDQQVEGLEAPLLCSLEHPRGSWDSSRGSAPGRETLRMSFFIVDKLGLLVGGGFQVLERNNSTWKPHEGL